MRKRERIPGRTRSRCHYRCERVDVLRRVTSRESFRREPQPSRPADSGPGCDERPSDDVSDRSRARSPLEARGAERCRDFGKPRHRAEPLLGPLLCFPSPCAIRRTESGGDGVSRPPVRPPGETGAPRALTDDLLHRNRLRFPHKRFLAWFSPESDYRGLPGIRRLLVPRRAVPGRLRLG
jgi:hypothetical protein